MRRYQTLPERAVYECARYLFIFALLALPRCAGASIKPTTIISALTGADACWDDRFAGSGGTNSNVNALAVDAGGIVYAAGDFTSAGGTSLSHIAKWDGEQWSALGSGIDGPVYALLESGGDVYAGGNFSLAGGVSASRIAKWNGSTWSALGTGMNGNVYGLALDAGGNLYAGGSFSTAGGTSASCIAMWNGSTWAALGTGMGTDGTVPPGVSAIVVDGTGLVYASGSFGTAGGSTVGYVARWDPIATTWSAMGGGMNGYVYGLALSGNVLYATGGFSIASGASANNVASWNVTSSTAWTTLGTGLTSPGGVGCVAVDSLGRVYVGGQITAAGGQPVSNFAMWTGSEWLSLGSGMNSNVDRIALSPGGDLYAGGPFTTAGGKESVHFAHLIPGCATGPGYCWDERFAGTNGTNSSVSALTEDESGNVYVGGDFSSAGGTSCAHVAKWDGAQWSALGTGINGPVYVLLAGGGYVYAGGNFTLAGGVSAIRLARWDGVSWSAVGTGMNGNVYALAFDSSGNLYVGGSFSDAGGTTASCIAMWDGSTWTALGTGMGTDGTVPPGVSGIAVDSGSGLVYASGSFGSAGGSTVGYVAVWDPVASTWSAMSTGMNGYVYSLALSGNMLYAAGGFTTASGAGANNIASWNVTSSTSWSPLGTGLSSSAGVGSLAVDSTGRVYAGGQIAAAGGQPVNNFAMWSGSQWFSLGVGMNNFVNHVLVAANDDLYAGGVFTTAGGKESVHFAHLFSACLAAVGEAPLIDASPQRVSAWPNPSRQSTHLHFDLASAATVRLDVHDVSGRRVSVPLANLALSAGSHDVTWDGRDASGARVVPGIYFVRLTTGGGVASTKVILLR